MCPTLAELNVDFSALSRGGEPGCPRLLKPPRTNSFPRSQALADEVGAAILRQIEVLHDRINEIAPRVLPEAYSLDQVATQLNVSKDTVKRWTDRGDLPTFRHGSVIRVRRTDLEKFLRKQTRFA